jgi:hypothetical protein
MVDLAAGGVRDDQGMIANNATGKGNAAVEAATLRRRVMRR